MAGRKQRALTILLCLLLTLPYFCFPSWAKNDFPAVSSQQIAPELPDSPEIWELDTGLDGAVILIVAGIHGDEVSGIQATEQLAQLPLTCGKLFWIPAANTYGAENNQRKARDDRDLNRNFPGDAAGNSTKQLAATITQQILDLQPDLILDLHEATAWEDGWDNLGNSIIFADLDPVADLIFELLDAESAPNLFSSPPAGSLNAYFSQECGIPVLTLEASRADSLETRVEYHLQMIEYILSYYQMM